MINNKTVLVLGAGSSHDFQFPLGETLIDQIKSKLFDTNSIEFQALLQLDHDHNSIYEFREILRKTGKTTIDRLLASKKKINQIGKDCIALILLQTENEDYIYNAEKNWYKLFYNQITENDFKLIKDQQISVMTFNYERSLEHYLFETIKTDYDENTAIEIMDIFNIVHLNGDFGTLPHKEDKNNLNYNLLKNHPNDQIASRSQILSNAVKISRPQFKTVYETNNINISVPINECFSRVETILFLGFGYDPFNIDLLPIGNRHKDCQIFGTALALSEIKQNVVKQYFKGKYNLQIFLINEDCFTFLKNSKNW